MYKNRIDFKNNKEQIIILGGPESPCGFFTMKNCICDTFIKNERNLNLKKGF